MAKKKSGASKGAKKIRPFDDMNTNDARAVSYTHLTLPTNREV